MGDFWYLMALLAIFVAGEVFFEWRAFRNRTTTISEYTHNLFFHDPVQTLFTGLFAGGILVHFAEFGALHCPGT